MLLWNGACIVHDEFKGLELELLRRAAPRRAWCWCTPSRRQSVVAQADVVGSTTQILNAVVKAAPATYIVATDNGILHRMRQLAPGKTLIEAPTAGDSATCKSCAHCPWMAMNALQGVVACLEQRQRRDRSCPSPCAARRWAASSACSTSSRPTRPRAAAEAGFVPNVGVA